MGAVKTYYQVEPKRPISPNFGSIQWPETPTPPHLRLFEQKQSSDAISTNREQSRKHSKGVTWIFGDKEVESESGFQDDPIQSMNSEKMPTRNGHQSSRLHPRSPYRAKQSKLVP